MSPVGSGSRRTRFPSAILLVKAEASFPNFSTGFVGWTVSGVSTPIRRRRSYQARTFAAIEHQSVAVDHTLDEDSAPVSRGNGRDNRQHGQDKKD